MMHRVARDAGELGLADVILAGVLVQADDAGRRVVALDAVGHEHMRRHHVARLGLVDDRLQPTPVGLPGVEGAGVEGARLGEGTTEAVEQVLAELVAIHWGGFLSCVGLRSGVYFTGEAAPSWPAAGTRRETADG